MQLTSGEIEMCLLHGDSIKRFSKVRFTYCELATSSHLTERKPPCTPNISSAKRQHPIGFCLQGRFRAVGDVVSQVVFAG